MLRRSSRKPEIAFVQHAMVLLIPQPEAGTEQAGPDARGAGKQRRMDIAQALRASLTDEFEAQRCVVGIGRSYEGLEGIRQGYREAVKAVRLGSKSQAEEGCVYYGDLGVYRLLHPLYHEEELKRLYEETIGPLVQYDRMHSGRLAETLSEFFACNGSLADTAEKLYIHVNTIKYRLDKIAQLTGCRVHDAEERLLLHMGLKIYHYLQSE
ncbi:Carbohydrate diacid regulator [Paenibacillus konkukensis]|uniref:Carbohydrate diacid regulator n=1 Tax=Paenibacillus konkukensis TaxID=2020716 RepID=A0ABY4S283_9BACL|nr:Carbohydrate diacid regulator [Paenibacillus konkukensis]